MPFRGIKINIAVNIALILLMAMLLTNIVVIITVQKNLTWNEGERMLRILSILENHLPRAAENEKHVDLSDLEIVFEENLITSDGACGVITTREGKTDRLDFRKCAFIDELENLARLAMESGEKIVRIEGSAWNVFIGESRRMLAAAPLYINGRAAAEAGVAMGMKGVQGALIRSQKVVWWYISINLFIFTFMIFYRISRLYLDPVRRLARRAEVYEEQDGVFFPIQKDANEIKSLSKALNSMLERISEDKKKLGNTVRSLEKANMELASAQKEIIRAEKLASVGRLSSGIAHEIGNPIGIVLGYLELLKQDDLTDHEKNEYIRRANDEINRINNIIRQLLDFARPSTDGMTHVSVHEIIHDVVDIIHVQPFMSEITLTLELNAENDHVHADPDQLKQVFLNLLINAADSIQDREEDPRGRLMIKSEIDAGRPRDEDAHPETDRKKDGMLKITCIDNGAGLPEENLENIFDPFFTTKEPGKGTGLGLAVSYTIIDRMGGEIEAANQDETGAAITIRLPISRPENRLG